jgi:hypothetical protein
MTHALLALFLTLTASAAEPVSDRSTGGIIQWNEAVTVQEGEHIDGPVVVFGNSAHINGSVNGPVVTLGGSVNLGPKATIDGPVVSMGGRTERSSGSSIEGPVIDTPGGALLGKLAAVLAYGAAAGASLYLFAKASTSLGWIIIGLVLTALFPKALMRTKDMLSEKLTESFLIGLAVWPALAVITVTLTVSLIGLPLIPLIWGGVAAAYVWGFTSLAFLVGQKISMDRWQNPFVSVGVGMGLLKLLQWVPVAQWVVCAAVLLWGVGVAILSGFGLRQSS